uniref:Uncharacterized protein n=2 Tax=Anguilla anguilla TaxID=7936 RepID=A0A0E9S623_ANGAN
MCCAKQRKAMLASSIWHDSLQCVAGLCFLSKTDPIQTLGTVNMIDWSTSYFAAKTFAFVPISFS